MNNIMCAEKITNLAKAMLEVQKVVRPAYKDKLNSFTQSRYATLNSVMEACSEALTYARRYGLSALVGIVTEDDDGNSACSNDHDFQRPRIADIQPRQNILESLPHIDDITYQQNKAQDGALYITATGNTRNKNGILKEAGFKWNSIL